MPYAGEEAIAALRGIRHAVLCGARRPVSNFLPDRSNVLTQPDCAFLELASINDDIEATLEALVAALSISGLPEASRAAARPEPRSGAANPEGIARVVTALIPENAIVVDEAITTGRGFARFTAEAAPHDWLQNNGGAIGYGMPASVGAALACPDRKVLCMAGDGSAM